MKRHLLAGLALLATALSPGCYKPQPVLRLYNWADYVKPALLARFEKENNCRIVLDTFDSNETLYAKLKGGPARYDLVFPSGYMLQKMRQQGMVEALNHALLPNLKHLDAAICKVSPDPAATVAVPYTVSYTGVGYLKSKVTNVVESWSMFDRKDLAGRMTMLNDMRETLAAGLRFLGFSSNTTNEEQLARAGDVVIRWKKNLAKFENEQYKSGLAAGEFLLVHGYVGDLLQLQAENRDIGIFFPKEGFVTTCDCMVIPKGARNVGLAHKYINFMLDPQVAAENTAFIRYLCPNKDSYALLPDRVRKNPTILVPGEIRVRSEETLDLGENTAKYVKVWDRIKAAK